MLSPKEAENQPWDTKSCVDLIAKYQFTSKGGGKKHKSTAKSGKSIYLQTVNMSDPVMGWIQVPTVPVTQADLVSNQVELTWLTCYPLPSKMMVDRGGANSLSTLKTR